MDASPRVEPFFHADSNTWTYLVWEAGRPEALVIDPVLDFDPKAGRTASRSAQAVLDRVAALGLRLEWVLETHAHADHLSAGDYLRSRTGAPIGAGSRIVETQKTFAARFGMETPPPEVFDRLFADGERFALGELEVAVMHTPGHTPACVSYHVGDAVFVGDTLFMPDYGTARADFPGGDAATLYRSIQRILALPPETRVFVGHDYLPAGGRTGFRWETTVAAERAENIHLGGGTTEAEFVAMRQTRDATLPPPKLLEPSLKANIRAGAI